MSRLALLGATAVLALLTAASAAPATPGKHVGDQAGNATVSVTFAPGGMSAAYTGDKGLSNYLVSFCDGTQHDVDSVGGDHKTFAFTAAKPIAWIQVKAGTTRATFARDCNSGPAAPAYPALTVSKKPKRASAEQGATVAYELAVSNSGEAKAEEVELCDVPGSGLTVAEATGAAVRDGDACWRLGDLAVGAQAKKTVKVKVGASASGTLVNTAVASADNAAAVTDEAEIDVETDTPGTPGGSPWPDLPAGGHRDGDHLQIDKAEVHVDLEAAETRTVTIACAGGALMTDAFPRVDHVDHGTRELTDVAILAIRSTGPSSYEAVLRNGAAGRAQLKLYGLCVGAASVNHGHPVELSPAKTVTQALAPGRHAATLRCGAGETPVAPGYALSGGAGRLVRSELEGADGWAIGLEVTEPTTATLSIRCLSTRTGKAGGHAHDLALSHVVKTVEVGPGQRVDARVTCHDEAKGIVATLDLPAGVVLLGHEPQPKTRVFRLLNPTAAPLTATIDLVCLGGRTGPATPAG
jgi:uncharacterized repeat protein (TIGR01451 family)